MISSSARAAEFRRKMVNAAAGFQIFDIFFASTSSNNKTIKKRLERRSRKRRSPYISSWYLDYVVDDDELFRNAAPGSYTARQFRHRFRMSWEALDLLYQTALTEKLFPGRETRDEETDGRRRRKHPLKLLMMGSLAVLGQQLVLRISGT